MNLVRVAFLLPHFRSGGAERVVLNLISALDRARYTPLLFLTKVEGAFLDLLPEDVQAIRLGAKRALFLPRHIARALAEHDVHIAYSATNAMNLALLAARTNVRRIVSEHTPPGSYIAQAKLPWLRARAMRHLYPRADAVAVPTAAIAAELGAMIPGLMTTQVLANPVVSALPDRLPDYADRTPLRMVSAGRLVPAKGFDTLIDACALLSAAGSDFRLAIYGEGPLRAPLQARIDAAHLGDRITLCGHSDRLDLALADADLFVLASEREGFGNVLIEAMAAGVPVLATVSGGPETFIRDGINGYLVEPRNPLALAATVTQLIAEPQSRSDVRAAALETARGFTVARATAQFAAVIDDLTANRSMRT